MHGIPEDDPRNPATIADNVGDNVGDVAGMGSDLFGSFAESTCAALVLGSSIGMSGGWDAMVFPVVVSAVGIFVCLICSFIATDLHPVRSETDVEKALKVQLISTTILMIPAVYLAAETFLPDEFELRATVGLGVLTLHPWQAVTCVSMGAVGGLIIGLVTEYYTSHSYKPVRELADSCKTGAATNMSYGIALGYKSAIIPVLVLATVVYGSFAIADMYGTALAAIGFLSNLATGLTIDVYGPVCDNAGGKCPHVKGCVSFITSFDTVLYKLMFTCHIPQVSLRWPNLSPMFAKRLMPLTLPVTQLPPSERDSPLGLLPSYPLPSLEHSSPVSAMLLAMHYSKSEYFDLKIFSFPPCSILGPYVADLLIILQGCQHASAYYFCLPHYWWNDSLRIRCHDYEIGRCHCHGDGIRSPTSIR